MSTATKQRKTKASTIDTLDVWLGDGNELSVCRRVKIVEDRITVKRLVEMIGKGMTDPDIFKSDLLNFLAKPVRNNRGRIINGVGEIKVGGEVVATWDEDFEDGMLELQLQYIEGFAQKDCRPDGQPPQELVTQFDA